MDFSALTHSKIGGIPAPIIVIGGGTIVGLYLRSRNKTAVANASDPSAVSQSSSLPTAIDPNTGAVYAIDPATGQAFQLPWNGGAGSVPLGGNNGINMPNPPSQAITPLPTPSAQPGLSNSGQPPPIGNVQDQQGEIATSNPVGSLSSQVTGPPVIVGTPVPVGTSPIQDIQAGYSAPQANFGQLAPIPQSPTQQPNYQGSLYMAGEHPFIYG